MVINPTASGVTPVANSGSRRAVRPAGYAERQADRRASAPISTPRAAHRI